MRDILLVILLVSFSGSFGAGFLAYWWIRHILEPGQLSAFLLAAMKQSDKSKKVILCELNSVLENLGIPPAQLGFTSVAGVTATADDGGCEFVAIDSKAKIITVFGSEKYLLALASPHQLIPVKEVDAAPTREHGLGNFYVYRFHFDPDAPE